jgi:iron complex outermembrane receptor protein
MLQSSRTRFRKAVLATCALSAMAFAAGAHAQTVRPYKVAGGDLKSALRQFARQSDSEILFDGALVAQKHTRGFVGQGAAQDVLNSLLSDSNLTYRPTSAGTLLVVSQAAPAPAAAPPPPRPQPAAAADTPLASDVQTTSLVEEVIVSGSRIVRDGYSAPTPVSVVSADQIQATANENLGQYIIQLPSLSGSTQPQTTASAAGAGGAGASSLNLRGLGTVRTLVLINGERTVGSLITGVVDVGTIPQQLITRVDVVTGGASAAYGSDALAGVVNFIIDNNFTGFKARSPAGRPPTTTARTGRSRSAAGWPSPASAATSSAASRSATTTASGKAAGPPAAIGCSAASR